MIRNLSHREFSRRELERHGEPLGECVTMPKIGGGYICGGGGKGSSPPAPDYGAAAQAQGESSKEVTNMQTYANRPTQNTPFGSVTWGTGAQIDPATGQAVTTWTQNYNLTPQAQNALNSQLAVQQGRSDLAQSFMGRVRDEYSQPFNWGALPQRGGNVGGTNFERLGNAPLLDAGVNQQAVQRNVNLDDNGSLQGSSGADRQRIESALFERMAPEHQRQQSALDAKLANQGITAGSEAYKQAQQALGDQQSRARFDALQTAGNEMSRNAQIALGNRQQLTNEDLQSAGLFNQAGQQAFNQELQASQFGNTALQNQFNMAQNRASFNNQVGQNQFAQAMQQSQYQNQLRQAALAEEMQRRGMSLNEMNALLTGQQVGMQQMPQFNSAAAAQPTQYLNAANMQYQSGLDAANMQNMNANSTMNGLFNLGGSLGSAATMGFMLSDSRLKKIIKRIDEKNGIAWYLFKYLGSNALYEGPMAQEVQKVKPEAVTRHHSGYLMVNYAALEA